MYVVSCEHGGNRIPTGLHQVFSTRAAQRALTSHRGWDPGALGVARVVARLLSVRLHATAISRLVVDTNRSLHHPRLFSEFTRSLGRSDRAQILKRHYWPHRTNVERSVVTRDSAMGPTVHIAVHSFTPWLRGRDRRFDIGLLYDPARRHERRLALQWKRELRLGRPGLRVRLNQPYRGAADGLATYLRRRYDDQAYVGFELELSQAYLATQRARAVAGMLTCTIERIVGLYAFTD
ncbi:MAG: N-formylglutamate amidohydrolase [Myxococcota bacterium]